MIVRLVKMWFKQDCIDEFQLLFDQQKEKIRGQKGCLHLELYQDVDDPCIFYTYSHWESQDDLNDYRHSELFGEVWPATKKLFKRKPEANSVSIIHQLP